MLLHSDTTYREAASMAGLKGVHDHYFPLVAQWLRSSFGAAAQEHGTLPEVHVLQAWRRVRVGVYDVESNEEALIRVELKVLEAVPDDVELDERLLRLNRDLPLASFAFDEEFNLLLTHSLLASSCTEQELCLVVETMLRVADKYDDRVQSEFGGVLPQ